MEIQSVKQRFGIIGNSPGLNNALSVAIRVASTELTTLITGESGVGKEVFSKIIHAISPRKHNPFIAVNCGAIPEGTIDSELFGHEKGAFTGANESRKGYFEQVHEGTIFLDEVGEMPLGTQARLLRILEAKEFIRVGSSKVQKTDVRVIAATNVDLRDNIKKGKFREDLFFRLNTVPIYVPPLRERKEDIPLLFRKFCVDFAERYNTSSIQLEDEAREVLLKYPWTGNIRELKNVAEQLSVLSDNKIIAKEQLLGILPKANQSNLPIKYTSDEESSVSEREILYKVLFDMKNDLNDLKKVVYGLVKNDSDVSVSDLPSSILNRSDTETSFIHRLGSELDYDQGEAQISKRNNAPIIINQEYTKPERDLDETFEESLSIADKEKELIEKALTKHKGRRKNAALDLGISERTLYRKIKEYNINE